LPGGKQLADGQTVEKSRSKLEFKNTIMKQQLSLEQLKFSKLNTAELSLIKGGEGDSLPPWLKKLGPTAVAAWIIDNWADVKSGAVDGWNSLK
jgi:hypothetical protein